MKPDLGAKSALPSEIGRRHSIRLQGSDGLRDLLGVLTSHDQITKKDGTVATFDPASIVAWRAIDELTQLAGKGAPLSMRIAELEGLSSETWPAFEVMQRGGWCYRTSDGYNFRSNSVLLTGEPEYGDPLLDLDHELEFLIGYFQERSITPAIALTLPRFELFDQQLDEKGWQVAIDAQMMVADKPSITLALESFADNRPVEVKIFDHPSHEFQSIRENSKALDVMGGYPASYICLFDSDGTGFAAGRIATRSDWAIITAVYIAPSHRGQGWSKTLMKAMLDQSSSTKIALQVDSANTIALNLYRSLGFRKHHDYRFRTWGNRTA